MPVIELLLWLAFAYLIAATPVGLLIGRLRGVDLREVGSGNIGATNAVRALGRRWGLLVFALDVGKAALPVSLALAHFREHPQGEAIVAAIALAAILGHVFPVYLNFRGGKGVACAFGVFLLLAPKAAAIALLVYLQTLVLTRVSAIGSLTAATVLLGVAWLDPSVPRIWALLCLGLIALVWWRHRDNLPRLLALARDAKRREAELERDSN
ncbi:glycerol-3-phosphate 1-O-acyltransferase PlsY [Nannocystaceae bacterium ST9]